MELDLLRTFLAVYRAGSLTRAAALLGRSQPTVTGQIRALETRVGAPLFERLARGVAPTSVADDLARRIGPHLDVVATTLAEVSGDPATTRQSLHLAGPAELTSELALPALADLVADGLRLRVTHGLADELLTGLAAGRYDVVLSTIRPRARSLTGRPLVDEELVLVGAARWADRVPADRIDADGAATLADIPLVTSAEDLPIIRRYWQTVFGARPAGGAALVVDDPRAILSAVVAGAGISVLPRYLCRGALAAGTVRALHAPPLPPIDTLYLATRTGTADAEPLATVRTVLTTAAHSW